MGELKFEIEEDAADQVVDPKEQAWRAVEEDRKVVEAEIPAYEAAGILDENHPESKDFYLLGYWQVCYPNDPFYSEFIQWLQSKQVIYPCCRKSCWMFCLLRRRLCLASKFSYQVKKRTHFDVQMGRHGRWKSSNFPIRLQI